MTLTSVEYQLTLPIAMTSPACIKRLFYRENRMHGRCATLLKMDAKAVQKKELTVKERKDFISQLMYTETNDASEQVNALFSIHVHTVTAGDLVPDSIRVGEVVCTCVYGLVAEDTATSEDIAAWYISPDIECLSRDYQPYLQIMHDDPRIRACLVAVRAS